MLRSPFPHNGPLQPSQVTGRQELVEDLVHRVERRNLTALLGPRRYGKTSVLRRVTADLKRTGTESIWIDLYELHSLEDVAAAFDTGLANTRGKVGAILREIGESFSLRLGAVGVEMTRAKRDRPDAALTLRFLVRAVVRAAQRRELVLVLDEFSGIAEIPRAAGIMRTELQHHYREMGILFAGSQPSTMAMMFGDRAQPFFAQADLVSIGPMSDSAVRTIVSDGFEHTNRQASDAVLDGIVALADGHAQRAMHLADAMWELTPEGDTTTETTWAEALADVRRVVDGGSEGLFEVMGASQQKVMRIVAQGGSLLGTAADVLDLSTGAARSAERKLIDDGQIQRIDDRLQVVDPLFADWLRRRFPI